MSAATEKKAEAQRCSQCRRLLKTGGTVCAKCKEPLCKECVEICDLCCERHVGLEWIFWRPDALCGPCCLQHFRDETDEMIDLLEEQYKRKRTDIREKMESVCF